MGSVSSSCVPRDQAVGSSTRVQRASGMQKARVYVSHASAKRAIHVPRTMRATLHVYRCASMRATLHVYRPVQACAHGQSSGARSPHQPAQQARATAQSAAQRQPSLALVGTLALEPFHANARALMQASELGKNKGTHRDEAPPLCWRLHLRTRRVRTKRSSRRRPGFARPCTCAPCVGSALDCLRQLHCTARSSLLQQAPAARAIGHCPRRPLRTPLVATSQRAAAHRTHATCRRESTACTDGMHTPRTHSSSPCRKLPTPAAWHLRKPFCLVPCPQCHL